MAGLPFTIRTVFVIDPAKKIRLTLAYPASTGRNTAEVLRVVQALQTTDKKGVTTPINWLPGDDVVIPPTVSTEAAEQKFGKDNIRVVKPYVSSPCSEKINTDSLIVTSDSPTLESKCVRYKSDGCTKSRCFQIF